MSSLVKKITKPISGLLGGITGATAAGEASQQAAGVAAQSQREALDYLKQREALPQEYREAALQQLGGLYGLGGEGDQSQLIEQARQSPLYGALMGGREAGEEAILRQAGATGGLRSGNVQENLYDYNTQLQNQSLMQAYNQQLGGLQGMAQLPSNAPQIAQGMAGIGQTQAQGIQAAGQAQQAGMGSLISGGLGALGAYFSDRRLKENIKELGEMNGHKVYSWDWNKRAGKMFDLEGNATGVIAQDIEKYLPDAVQEYQGYKTVDYNMLGIS